jgi:hypothetical protein
MNPSAKLSVYEVLEIRNQYNGENALTIAKHFGVAPELVRHVVKDISFEKRYYDNLKKYSSKSKLRRRSSPKKERSSTLGRPPKFPPSSNPNMKTCNRCKIEQHQSQFCKDGYRKDGLNPICRTCQSTRNAEVYAAKKKKEQEAKAQALLKDLLRARPD